jgi:lysophospholipase L1-like esterase
LGDSLSAPRPAKGQPLEITWPGLLKTALPTADIWQRARPRSCSLDVLAEFKLFTESLTRFDAIVVQMGIVDCWPRPYPRWFIKVFEVFATFEQLRAFDRAAHKRFMWAYGRSWVSRVEFKANLQRLIADSIRLHPGIKVLLIPIVSPTRRMLDECRDVARSVADYNEAMREAGREFLPGVQVIDPFAGHDPLELTLEDGHHLTALGHRLIAGKLESALACPCTV